MEISALRYSKQNLMMIHSSFLMIIPGITCFIICRFLLKWLRHAPNQKTNLLKRRVNPKKESLFNRKAKFLPLKRVNCLKQKDLLLYRLSCLRNLSLLFNDWRGWKLLKVSVILWQNPKRFQKLLKFNKRNLKSFLLSSKWGSRSKCREEREPKSLQLFKFSTRTRK